MQKLIFFLLSCFVLNIVQAQPPTITTFSPASGPVGSLVTINGTNLGNPTSITIGGVVALPISNTGTKLVAMVMPNTVSGAVAVAAAGGSVSSGGSFSVVTSVPPSVQQGNKLVGNASFSPSNQGISSCISADGNTVAVGGYSDNNYQGAAWVFTNNNGVWEQQGGKLVGTGNIGAAQQGATVSISADGNTLIMGGGI